MRKSSTSAGFTLIELLAALLILSLLALMSYRGLGAVLDARDHVDHEAAKWRRVGAFFQRFGRDVQLAEPRAVREGQGTAPAWRGQAGGFPALEFSRFASTDGVDTARRLAYGLNARGEIELWIWPGLDVAPGVQPARYPVLAGVKSFSVQYLAPNLAWVDAWPASAAASPLPRALRVSLVLASGEEIVRVFSLV
ncbi:MAG: type II secretion system protein GspJ [Burkholderiales bacterium]